MAALPPVKSFKREDFKDAPKWIDRLLTTLNVFMSAVYGALNKTLTFKDNIVSQRQEFFVVAGASATDNTAKFLLTMKQKPTGLILLNAVKRVGNYAAIGSAVFIEWTFDGTHVNITSITGLTNGSTYDFTVLMVAD